MNRWTLVVSILAASALAASAEGQAPEKAQRGKLRADTMPGERVDKDGDGKITRGEIESRAQEMAKTRFDQLDKNGDNKVSEEEFSAGRSGPGMERLKERRPDLAGKLPSFADLDKNSDGSLSLGEFKKPMHQNMMERFKNADTDGDGVLTPDEKRANREKFMQEQGGKEDPMVKDDKPGKETQPGKEGHRGKGRKKGAASETI